MKNRILKLLVPLLAMCFASTAFASRVLPKTVQIQWERTTGVTDGTSSVGTYSTPLANGVHGNAAGVAPAATTRDTSQGIFVGDHWANDSKLTPIGVLTDIANDSLGIYGTLHLQSTKNSLDSIVIVRQWSNDNQRWNTVDSVGGHFVAADSLINGSSAVTDSIKAVNGVVGGVQDKTSGIVPRIVNYSWPCNPRMGPQVVTAIAGQGFQYIRFIVTMTNGDYVAAGLSDGWRGWFTYSALDPNFNR